MLRPLWPIQHVSQLGAAAPMPFHPAFAPRPSRFQPRVHPPAPLRALDLLPLAAGYAAVAAAHSLAWAAACLTPSDPAHVRRPHHVRGGSGNRFPAL